MDVSETFKEDLVSNLLLGLGMIAYFGLRDLCKRISHSDCRYGETGLIFSLSTWHERDDDDDPGLV